MSDFRELLKMNTDEIKRPNPTPAGTWYGLVFNYEYGESKEKKTPYVRYGVRITSPGADISDDDKNSGEFVGREYDKDYFLTPDALWRLSEMISTMKVKTTGRPLDETIPEIVGKEVMLTVGHERPKNLKPTDPPYARITDMVGKPD